VVVLGKKKGDLHIEKRLLPGDFARALHKYHQLSDTEKELEEYPGLFIVPKELRGDQDFGVKDFLVFYFDDHEEYELVKSFFEIPTRASISHPKLDSKKLAEVVKNATR